MWTQLYASLVLSHLFPGVLEVVSCSFLETVTVATAVYEFVNSWCARTLAHRPMLEVAAAATGVNTCVLNRM